MFYSKALLKPNMKEYACNLNTREAKAAMPRALLASLVYLESSKRPCLKARWPAPEE